MSVSQSRPEARQPNWLPVPAAESILEVVTVEEDDLFTKGEVMSFHPRQKRGRIKDAKGNAVRFNLSEAKLIGPKGDPRYLSAGARIGYDVGWTSAGLHITKIKVY
jgi:hypothetical protein